MWRLHVTQVEIIWHWHGDGMLIWRGIMTWIRVHNNAKMVLDGNWGGKWHGHRMSEDQYSGVILLGGYGLYIGLIPDTNETHIVRHLTQGPLSNDVCYQLLGGWLLGVKVLSSLAIYIGLTLYISRTQQVFRVMEVARSQFFSIDDSLLGWVKES